MPRSASRPRSSNNNDIHLQRHFSGLQASVRHEASQAMSIRQLPEDVVNKIKSSVVVTSLNGVACGLLANSLDAGATKVNISIDYSRGNCTVEDNGSGIPPQEFQTDGGLGKLHHTSRFPHKLNTHGKHGDFLASVATLSLLSITSRHHGHISHNSLSIHHAKVLTRHLPSPPEQRLVNFDHGTRVTVRDLFGCMPVRVKQRSLISERSAQDKEWAKLVREAVALLLAWPTGINVCLRAPTVHRELRFRPSEKTDLLSRTSRLLTQASLADSGDANAWVPISGSSGSVTVQGCICENPVATRRSQFISFGIYPALNEYGTNVLYEEINKVFGSSSFGLIENGNDVDPTIENYTAKELRSRKSIERWPMFYLKVTFGGRSDSIAMDSLLDNRGPELAVITDLLKTVCYRFLEKHRFRPRRVQFGASEGAHLNARTSSRPSRGVGSGSRVSSAVGSTSSRHGSPFDDWHRVKAGSALSQDLTRKLPDSRPDHIEPTLELRLVGEGGKLLRKPFDEPLPDLEPVLSSSYILTNQNVDHSRKAEYSDAQLDTLESDSRSEVQVPREKRRRLEPKSKRQQSQWLQNVIRSWENPVFETVQNPIPRINDECPRPSKRDLGTSHHFETGKSDVVSFDSASMNLIGRISRQALIEATVISQVDRKFVLIKLPLNSTVFKPEDQPSNSTLVMLDQHAADERCRLEELMASYFTGDGTLMRAEIETLESPISWEVTPKERDLLEQYRDHLSTWGIILQVHRRSPKITVTALPPSILERCRLEPRLIVDLVRKEIWRIADEGLLRRARPENQGDKPWVSHFHGCPQGILDMLNSRACRSAIMFNDVLTKDDCESLLARLAKCAFPFQCAHGRPSMVPIVDLGVGGRFGGWTERQPVGQSLVQWMKKL